MPELPEVETTRLGIAEHLLGEAVVKVDVRHEGLRWKVDATALQENLQGQAFTNITRRGKYLLLRNRRGHMICHLGMSGSLRIITDDQPLRKHDHIEWRLSSGSKLRFHDPRRFGCVLWHGGVIDEHPLIRRLGPEPLSGDFNAGYLYARSRKRKIAVKSWIMDSRVVAGVGNIYANESLFLAGIHPHRPAGRISRQRYMILTGKIKQVLKQAIDCGGTTLRDFVNSKGRPGYFQQNLHVYERQSLPCRVCRHPLIKKQTNQRASYFCPHCQT